MRVSEDDENILYNFNFVEDRAFDRLTDSDHVILILLTWRSIGLLIVIIEY